MRLCILDTETTGLNPEKDQIIELCALSGDLVQKQDRYTMSGVSLYNQRIKPTIPIDIGAQKVHGISAKDLENSPSFIEVEPQIHEILNEADVIVAHNAGFDIPFIYNEFARHGKVGRFPDREVFCTKEDGRWATFTGKYPKLEELAFACGYNYNHEKAHAAEYDVKLTTACLMFGINSGFFKIPELSTGNSASDAKNCYGEAA